MFHHRTDLKTSSDGKKKPETSTVKPHKWYRGEDRTQHTTAGSRTKKYGGV